MTEKEANALFEKWRKMLHLEDWEIRFKWSVRADDLPENVCGSTNYVFERKMAVVAMMNEVDYTNELFPYDYEQVLVHELLHLKFAAIDDSENALQNKLVHQLIDDVAKWLVNASRNIGGV